VNDDDPFLWLEEVEAQRRWLRVQNQRSLASLESDPRYDGLYRDALAVVTAPDRILSALLATLANSADDAHPRGLWRTTTASFAAKPDGASCSTSTRVYRRGRNWVFHGSIPLRPEYRRCLVSCLTAARMLNCAVDVAAASFVEVVFCRRASRAGFGSTTTR
jgi:prolyl oligopeptidase